jgi:dipeptidyl aminopeptidase/acylaminoacyl peptidase
MVIAGSATEDAVVASLAIGTGTVATLRRPAPLDLDPALIARAEPIEFPTAGGRTAHAFFYPPTNPAYVGQAGHAPPLLVKAHGGPTGQADPTLDLGIQYWTSRGFAVVDVNYGGSSGYGRAYRDRLRGNWGVTDVEDVVAAARYLAAQGRVDPRRLAIRGGSAGGFTTLAALAFHDVFAAGASYYGVSDLEALAHDTHKFEARYLDGLVAPLPQGEAVYRQRAPIHHLEGFRAPLIVLQGLEDRIVPPAQSEAIVAALDAKGVPVAYLPFPGEQHGFRRAETIIRAHEAELYFYGRVFGFTPADPIAPVPIRHLP